MTRGSIWSFGGLLSSFVRSVAWQPVSGLGWPCVRGVTLLASLLHAQVCDGLSPLSCQHQSHPGERSSDSSPLFYPWGSHLTHLQLGVQPETQRHPRIDFWGFLSGSLCVLLPHISATSVSLNSDTSPELSGTSVRVWVLLPNATIPRGPSGESRNSHGAASFPVAQRPALGTAHRSAS